jgi:Integrase zinc binding domain
MPRNVFHGGRRMIEIIIDHAHQTVGHYSQLKTSNYIRRAYWWPSMATDIELFCTLCVKCQMNKTSTQQPKGLLHSLPTPDRLRTKGHMPDTHNAQPDTLSNSSVDQLPFPSISHTNYKPELHLSVDDRQLDVQRATHEDMHFLGRGNLEQGFLVGSRPETW